MKKRVRLTVQKVKARANPGAVQSFRAKGVTSGKTV